MEPRAATGWGRALLAGSAVLVASVIVLLVVPDRLMAFLSPRVSPAIRDVLVVAWVGAWLLVLTAGIMAIQRRRGA